MNQFHGLNSYKSTKGVKKFSFTNFKWALKGAVARGSQPGYTFVEDTPHTITKMEATFLKHNKIACVISANKKDLDQAGKENLRAAGIGFYNFKVKDFTAPADHQLVRAARAIEYYKTQGRATLVYCGFGEGRTGTFIAAWAMLHYLKNKPGANVGSICNRSSLEKHFGVEKEAQVQAVRAVAGLPVMPVAVAESNTSSCPPSGLASFAPLGLHYNGSGIGFPDNDNYSEISW